MRTSGALICICVCVAVGCSTPRRDNNGLVDGNGSGSGTDSGSGSGSDTGSLSIYAHTSSTLYRVDPDTLAISMVGPFGISDMTDIAIDKTGRMIGVSFSSVYNVDPTTAHATLLSNALANQFNGLSFVPASSVGMTGDDVLIGTQTSDGKVFRVDPLTGATTQTGDMGSAYSSSGDLVAVDGFGMIQTIKGGTHDVLARLAPTTFAATPIGTNTGYDGIWGVGFWKNTIYGFTDSGQFLKIDPTTGAATVVASNGPAWWGAAVTTAAPVIF